MRVSPVNFYVGLRAQAAMARVMGVPYPEDQNAGLGYVPDDPDLTQARIDPDTPHVSQL